ncbi:MarR family transcriptional regulator [Actinoplanes hulinensis]|uniref:MarR family transcriptional regulator n=1 Tax=Actinoplanes hulinensis TaxID=1144547 RepID=A0ABS7BHM2_9ACTN|nr:MarR family transcriptional regulator [Actinoplanes hulinensis]MBW6440378.1 MarR family transcriptional regulator [Actinoplanes hulinensis]
MVRRELGYLVLQAGRLVQSAVDDVADEFEMPSLDLLALYVLGQHEGMTGRALARMLHVQQSSITPLADRLESAGLIERERDETDRRRVWLCPTPAGHELAGRAATAVQAVNSGAFAPLSPGAATALAALLGEVVEPWITGIVTSGGKATLTGDGKVTRNGPG